MRKGQTIHQKVPIKEREWRFERKKFERKVTVTVSMTTQMMQEGERKREKLKSREILYFLERRKCPVENVLNFYMCRDSLEKRESL
jgi:hypothetical protein